MTSATTSTPWDREKAAEVIAAHQNLEGPALPILHALQETFGHVPQDAIPLLAEALNLSRADVHGIVSFYHDFKEAPGGRHVVKLCRAEACQSMGGHALAEGLLHRLGLDWGGTTGDGQVTIEPVYCLGLCACAPAALIDGRPLGRLNRERLDAAVNEARNDWSTP
ncbi:formate dehydrogenase subunit gamma [Nitrospirillum amazonense]|uniref:formate dehydrogenase subunit gamma n=1 Tax=Nitrospirillum amazonense TaxID=28077 RepID=UPI0011A917FB|nr:formate dehydrogenase subunit gamma [Nitrospirillum amazonense]